MQYKKMTNEIYLRIDKDEPLIETIKNICEKEGVFGGYFRGIGACDKVVLQTYIPEKKDFISHTLTGMIEMISLSGNISKGSDALPFLHSHATFSQLNDKGEIVVTAGHMQEANISYTGEIIISPANETIERQFDPNVGIEVWKF